MLIDLTYANDAIPIDLSQKSDAMSFDPYHIPSVDISDDNEQPLPRYFEPELLNVDIGYDADAE